MIEPTAKHVISRAEFARRSGRSRAAITMACAGPLAGACLPGGRLDAQHPVAAEWARARGVDPATLVGGTTSTSSGAPASTERARRAPAVQRARAPYLEARFVGLDVFAHLAGETLATVDDTELAPAMLIGAGEGALVDLLNPFALRYLTRRPFPRDEDGELLEDAIPAGMLAPACRGARVDIDHPRARAFFARCSGDVGDRVGLAAERTGEATH